MDRKEPAKNSNRAVREQNLIVALTCPSCRGQLSVMEGDRLIRCPYCQNIAYLQGETGVHHYQIRRQVDMEQAKKRFQRFLHRLQNPISLRREAELIELFPLYMPFWNARAKVAAWVFGEKKVYKDIYSPREKQFLQEMDWAIAACDAAEYGVKSIKLNGQKLQAIDLEALQREAMVLEPLGVAGDALKDAENAFRTQVTKQAKLDKVSDVYLGCFDHQQTLVYVPLWVARYRFRQREYQVVIDGSSGEVLFGKAPGAAWRRALRFILTLAAGPLLFDVLLFLLFPIGESFQVRDIISVGIYPFFFSVLWTVLAYRHFTRSSQTVHRHTGNMSISSRSNVLTGSLFRANQSRTPVAFLKENGRIEMERSE